MTCESDQASTIDHGHNDGPIKVILSCIFFHVDLGLSHRYEQVDAYTTCIFDL